jgi:hypothetical protein
VKPENNGSSDPIAHPDVKSACIGMVDIPAYLSKDSEYWVAVYPINQYVMYLMIANFVTSFIYRI